MNFVIGSVAAINSRQVMNNKFDQLAKSVAQSVTRRGALKKFSVGLATMALACFGLANKAEAGRSTKCIKRCMGPCVEYYVSQGQPPEAATSLCQAHCAAQCTRLP